MKKVLTKQELVAMEIEYFQSMEISLKAKAYRLMGIPWKKYIHWYVDKETGDIVFEYE